MKKMSPAQKNARLRTSHRVVLGRDQMVNRLPSETEKDKED